MQHRRNCDLHVRSEWYLQVFDRHSSAGHDRLRRKLADISAQHLQIQAVRGQGYILVDTEQP